MAVSQAQKLANEKYRREKRDQLAVDIPKGKRAAYKLIAAELGLSLSLLVQNSVENYAGNAAEVITTEQRRIIDAVGKLNSGAQKQLLKFLDALQSSEP